MSSSIKSKLEQIESNVKGVKKGLINMKQVFEDKGVINNANALKINLNKSPNARINNAPGNRNNAPEIEIMLREIEITLPEIEIMLLEIEITLLEMEITLRKWK